MRVFQKLGDVDAHHGGRHHAEIGKRRVASADAWNAHEDLSELVSLGDALHFRAGIGDGDEAVADFFFADLGFHAIEKILLVDVGFERAARFAGNDADRAAEVHALFEGFNLRGIRGIQDVKVRIARGLAEGHAKDFGTEAGAAHAEQQSVLETRLFNIGGDLFQLVNVLDLLLGNIQPAEPLVLVRARPKRGILLPKPLHFAVLLPILKRGVYIIFEFVGECVGLAIQAHALTPALFPVASRSCLNASAKSLTPSRRSLSVASFMEMPALARLSMVVRAALTSSVKLLRSLP